MVWCVAVLVRHVGAKCSTPRATARRMLHRDAVFRWAASRASADDHTGLLVVPHHRRILDRHVAGTDRSGAAMQWLREFHRSSRLFDRAPGAAGVHPIVVAL